MAEGLSAAEVGKEIDAHGQHSVGADHGDRHDRLLTIAEAVLLALVAVVAAYSGYAAAKWSTHSSVTLAKASTLRSKASRANLEALQIRTLDSVSFNAWFTAFVAGHTAASALPKGGCAPVTVPHSTRGLRLTPPTTRTPRPVPRTCRST